MLVPYRDVLRKPGPHNLNILEIVKTINKIEGCELKKVADLPFEHIEGGCRTFNYGQIEKILLCFGLEEEMWEKCHT